MLGKFLDYIEIKTKITSLFAFLMTLAYLFYEKKPIHWNLAMIFFASMFLFDLATTAINNYIDTRTNGLKLPVQRKTGLFVIFLLLALSTALGIWLAVLTDIVVLGLGTLCFACGVLYTFGPVPISRQPLGELFSGVLYGLFIPFLLLYINLPAGTYLTLTPGWETIGLQIRVWPVFTVLLLSVVPVCATANIMLANNICDMERDIQTRRFTLAYYLGKRALHLFAGLYYIAFADILLMTALKILSPVCLLMLPSLIPVQRNIVRFYRQQDKGVTFICSIQNYVILMGSLTAAIFISGWVPV